MTWRKLLVTHTIFLLPCLLIYMILVVGARIRPFWHQVLLASGPSDISCRFESLLIPSTLISPSLLCAYDMACSTNFLQPSGWDPGSNASVAPAILPLISACCVIIQASLTTSDGASCYVSTRKLCFGLWNDAKRHNQQQTDKSSSHYWSEMRPSTCKQKWNHYSW